MKTTDREKNQLIANFMGYHVSDNQIKDENGFWVDANVFKNSWDWLMPVINKISDISFQDEGDVDDFYSVRDCIPEIHHSYNAVVEFIKQYNETKK